MVAVSEALTAHATMCKGLHEPYPLLALSRAHHQNKRGEPMSFADKPFLVPLYTKWLDIEGADVCKAPQTGISELLIQMVLYHAGWNDRICAYVLPQYKTSERFVGDRVDPVITRVAAYNERLGGGDWGAESAKGKGNLKRKRFGRMGSLLFLGSNTPADFLEFSADLLIIDEYDECMLRNVAKAKDRIRESKYPQLFRVSNPKFPGQGVSKLWKEGDRQKWFHRCPRCGERQALDWFKHFVARDDSGNWQPRDRERANDPARGDLRPMCQRCRNPWDRGHVGCWVAENRAAARESIHMSRLDVLATQYNRQPIRGFFAEWVLAQGDISKLAAFFIGVLGWAHESEGSRITQEILEAARDGERDTDWEANDLDYELSTVIMGVDVGAILNVVIDVLDRDEEGNILRRGKRICTVPRFEDLQDLQAKYHVDVMVIDSQPETRKAKEIRDYYFEHGGCEVWLCRYFPTGKIGAEDFGITMDYEEQVVTVDRTQLLDACMAEMVQGLRKTPGDSGTILGFDDQMKAPIRKLNEHGNRMIWDEGNEADHFRHADAYARVGQALHDVGGTFDAV